MQTFEEKLASLEPRSEFEGSQAPPWPYPVCFGEYDIVPTSLGDHSDELHFPRIERKRHVHQRPALEHRMG